MVTGTRSTARDREDLNQDIDNRATLERDATALIESRGAEMESTSAPKEAHSPMQNETDDEEELMEAELQSDEEELAQYAEWSQDRLEDQLQKMKARTTRKRLERELLQLRKEYHGGSASRVRNADETLESTPKRRRTSFNDDMDRRPKRWAKPVDPPMYHGRNVKELEEFLIYWVIHWEAHPEEPEESRVRSAAAYLRAVPMKMWGQRIESHATPLTTWDGFRQWLRDTLKAPNQRTLESTLALKEMKQRDSQSCKDLYIYMCELENNIPTMSEEQRRAWTLVNALKPELRSRIVRDLQVIENVDAVIACAARNESTTVDSRPTRKTELSGAKTEDGNALPARTRQGRDSTSSGRGRGRGNSFRGRGSHSTSETNTASRTSGACYNCDKEGHIARNCPEPEKTKNG